jgi:glucose-6-phosphate isomerase
VESAKQAARDLMDAPGGTVTEPLAVDGAVQVRADNLEPSTVGGTVGSAVAALLAELDPHRGYLALMVYLDRIAHAGLETVTGPLTTATQRPVTFGWGPRFLHSTGQFHKGGPPVGVYLQVTGDPVEDYPVPGKDFSFGSFVAAQAAGDARVLADQGRPVLRLHLTDQSAGLAQLREALGGS